MNAPPTQHTAHGRSFLTFLAISRPKMVLEGKNVLFKAMKLANAHGRLLGVLRYIGF